MCLFALTLAARLPAQAPGSPDEPSRGPAPPPGAVTLHLRDGALVRGRVSISTVEVETDYGVLVVPVADLIEVRLAQRLPAQLSEEVEAALARLGSEDFDEREAAQAELGALGRKAAPILRAALGHEDDEVRSRVQDLLASIDNSEPPPVAGDSDEELAREPARGREDEVLAKRFSFRGRLRLGALGLETPYGKLEVELAEVAAASFGAGGATTQVETVPATAMAPNLWHTTRVTLGRGDTLKIKGSGQMQVPNYNLTTGPDGTRRYSGSTLGGFPMLSLVGKIGKTGKPFLIGLEYRGKASREGRLHLGVVPFRRNSAATGSYKAEIETGR